MSKRNNIIPVICESCNKAKMIWNDNTKSFEIECHIHSCDKLDIFCNAEK